MTKDTETEAEADVRVLTSDQAKGAHTELPGPNQRRERERKRRLARWFRRIALFFIAAAAVVAIAQAMRDKPIVVSASTAERSAMVVSINEDGKSRVIDRFVVSSPLTGHIGRLTWHPGDTVDEETVLARIVPLRSRLLDDRSRLESEARLAAAYANLQQAQAVIGRTEAAFDLANNKAERHRDLFENKAITRSAFDESQFARRARKEEHKSARFGRKVAEQQVRIAKAALGRLSSKSDSGQELIIKSPIKGVLLRVFHESEGVAQVGKKLLEVGDPAALEIVADVLTRDAVHVRPGAQVRVTGWGGDHDLDAQVKRVEPAAFSKLSALGVEEQRVNIVIDLEAEREKWQTLGDGYRVEVDIEIWSGNDILQVPASSVFRTGDQWAVFVVRGGLAVHQVVTIGHRNRTAVEILSGVEAGTKVITHPSDQIKTGTAIELRAGG